ncbi:hypothetical protein LR48_Vigan07g131400 [Vigna angularis]|uniref:Uncharacterized protein n=1 Tax=Phaseolus angularis TaxID=3914 RepID=A0A0L9UXN2_PHAAN|nr:hypothetical protein LR48_Vigan07g131400 [Vigna angularis]
MECDPHQSPFMKTAKVIINVDDGTIALKDQEYEVIFNVFNAEQRVELKKTSLKTSSGDTPEASTKVAKPGLEPSIRRRAFVAWPADPTQEGGRDEAAEASAMDEDAEYEDDDT